ncbi:MAG TPA: DUF6769 family protein [Bacteroidales bacterium]|nr:DUF6769 family protein [Bacteroidales bacterium]
MRKTFSILFMFISMLVMMMHALIPHHHHDSYACFYDFTKETDQACHDHDGHGHKECDGDGDNDDCCSLNDLLAILPDLQKNDQMSFIPLAYEWPDHLTPDLISEMLSEESYKIFRNLHPKPLISPSYKLLAARSIGLRAPPAC